MNQRHFPYWPERRPYSFPIPDTNVAHNLATSAARYPAHAAIVYYDTPLTYERVWREVEALAGFLERTAGVKPGHRVLLDMQNSPQWAIAYYAILRANAMVVPVNPMSVTDELTHYIDDSEAKVAIVGQELFDRIAPLIGTALERVIVAAYNEYLERATNLSLPPAVAAPPKAIGAQGVVRWRDALAAGQTPGPISTGANDLAVLPYTSGTTGKPKGCVHTHRSVQTTALTCVVWGGAGASAGGRVLSVLPYFHVTGMTVDLNATWYTGSTIVMMTRWDAGTALELIERYQCNALCAISTMVVDLLAHPDFKPERLASLESLAGGGAALPAAVGEELTTRLGLHYREGYGLTETIAMTHGNPPERTKLQCLGIPAFDVDSRVIDPETLRELGPNETGEIVIHGPQVMREYWRRPQETAEAFIEIDGKRFLRTGDLGYIDDEGYFFMVDRLKRMINAAGFKVWPAEVETKLFAHPSIKEACVISSSDPRKGEIVKALVVPRDGTTVSEAEIIAWSRERMSAYKIPAVIEFVESLPRSASGKVQWRELQERENQRAIAAR